MPHVIENDKFCQSGIRKKKIVGRKNGKVFEKFKH